MCGVCVLRVCVVRIACAVYGLSSQVISRETLIHLEIVCAACAACAVYCVVFSCFLRRPE